MKRIDYINKTKYCSICKCNLSWDSFYFRQFKTVSSVPYGWCKNCTIKRNGASRRKYGHRYLDKQRVTSANYKKRNNTKNKFTNLKSEAKRRNYSMNITFIEYENLMSKPCYYCGCSLKELTGGCLDRIDNNLGYEIDNVLPCCGICNKTRHNAWTVAETKVMIKAALEYRNKHD